MPEQKKTTAIVLHQQSSPSQLVNGYKPDPTSLGEQVQKEGVFLHHAACFAGLFHLHDMSRLSTTALEHKRLLIST